MSKLGTQRDAGFRRVGAATKWLAGGAAVLTGVLTVVAARSTGNARATTTPDAPGGSPATSTAPAVGSDVAPTDPGLQAPDTLPQPTRQRHVARSGGT